MDKESKQKKSKKTHRGLPPLPQPDLKKEKTYHGNYVDEEIVDDDRYLDDKNKSKSLEQFSKKIVKKRKNYSDYDKEKYVENENQVDSDNESQNDNQFYNNPNYVFNFDDFDTGKRPDAFYDEGDHDPIFEKLKIQINSQSLNNSLKVSLRSNSAPFSNKMVQPKKKEESDISNIRKRQHSEAVMQIHDQQNQFKFSSDNENNNNEMPDPKEKKKNKKKSRKGSGTKKKAQPDDDE